MSEAVQTVSIDCREGGSVSGLLCRPENAVCLYVLAHGAGADMHHHFLESAAAALAQVDIATLRYQFPYTEAGGKRPDRAPRLESTVRDAVTAAAQLAPDLPRIAGGKSMGGRMTSRAAAAEPLGDVAGLAFLGFPLHPPGKPGSSRADHLADVTVPMLFIQGTRDTLANQELIEAVVKQHADRSTLHIVTGGDHSFKVLKRKGPGAGRSPEEIQSEIAQAIRSWVDAVVLR